MDPTSLPILLSLAAACLTSIVVVGLRPIFGVHLWAALLPFQFVFLREHANLNFAPSDPVAVGLVTWLAVELSRRRRCPSLGRAVTAAVGFVAPLTLSLVLGVTRGTIVSYALVNKWLGYTFLVLTAVAVVVAVDGRWSELRRVLRTFLVAVFASVVVSVASYWLGYDYFWFWATVQSNRLSGTLLEAPPYGGLLVVAFAVQTALLLAGVRAVSTGFDWTNACLLSHAITLTFSRSVYVGLAGSVVVLVAAAVVFRHVIGATRLWKAPAILLLVAAVTVPAAMVRPIEPIAPLGTLFGTGSSRPRLARSRFLEEMLVRQWTTNLRLTQFAEGLRWWAREPVAGIGLGRFLAESPRWFGVPYQIHNTYIWLLVETGLIGALWFCAFIVFVGDEFLAAGAAGGERRWWALGLAAAFAGVLGFMVGNEGLYQRHLWLIVAAGAVLNARGANNRFRHRTGEPPRAIQVVTRMNVGGITQQVIVLADELRRRGYAAEIAAGVPGPAEGDRSAAARALGLEVHSVRALSNRINPARDAWAFVQLLWLFVRRRPDVVHLYMLKARLLGGAAARAAGVPIVVETLHGNVLQGYYGRMASAAIRLAERVAGRLLVDRVIAVTGGQREELLRFGVAPANRLVLQLPGMDVSSFRDLSDKRGELRRRLHIPASSLIVGTIGRLVPIKGLDVFLDAAARVATGSGADVRFVIAGDGPLRQELETQRDRLGLGNRCVFLGEISDIRGFYADCDIVVMSSRNEGAPIVLMEAMGAGKPIVATRVGGVPDMVADGISALLVPADDEEALARAVLRVISDTTLREQLARAAWLRADDFNVQAFAEGTDRLYQALV